MAQPGEARHIARSKGQLRRRGKATRERIGLQPLFHLAVGPGIRAAFVKNSDSDHADIAGIAVFLIRIRFPHGSETKCRHRLCALPKTFHHKLAVWINEVAALSKRGRATIDDIEPVHGKNDFQTQIASIANDDGVAPALLAGHKPPVADTEPRQKFSALIAQANGDQTPGWTAQERPPAAPLHRPSHGAASGSSVLINGGDCERLLARALEWGRRHARNSGLAPFCSETGPVLRRLGERRALPSRGGPIKTRCDFRGSAGREKRCYRDRRNETRRFHIWMIESKPQGARE